MRIIHVFSCKNSGVIPAIFSHRLKNKNFGVLWWFSGTKNSSKLPNVIPVKYNVDS